MSEAIIIVLIFLLVISLTVNFIAIIVAWKTDKQNERLQYKRIVNNARRKVYHRKMRSRVIGWIAVCTQVGNQYDELVEDFEKLERQPRITKSENGVMTITEPFLHNMPIPNLKSGDIIIGERTWFKSRKR